MYQPREQNGECASGWPEEPRSGARPITVRHADALIIGAGIAGLSVAYQLLKEGRSVIVVDRAQIGARETARSSGHLADALDDHYCELERMHGLEGARRAAESHRAGIESIAVIAGLEGIDCGLRRVDGYLYPASPDHEALLDRELRAAERAGLAVEPVPHVPGVLGGSFALRFRNQAQMDPRAYVAGLAHAVERRGGVIYTERCVAAVREGLPHAVQLDTGEVLEGRVLVVATNTPFHDRLALHTKQAAYRTYHVAIAADQRELGPGLYWDTLDPYHYVRWLDDETLLVGGEDHRVGQGDHALERYARLEAWVRERFRTAGEVRARWSGQILEPMDGLAFIGHSPGSHAHSYVITGDSGNGLTHAALGGLLLADLISGRSSPWAALYDPSRSVRSATALASYAQDNTRVALSYLDWVKPAEEASVAVAPGGGAVVQRGLTKLALSADEQGVRHACSAVCPHLGGVVRWNPVERSWDCPAHGSRFSPRGALMNGPAGRDLSEPNREAQQAAEAAPAVDAHAE
jgi:glycine/D-amino acid oxidase-like deaminating enzyme/nitrite reductase/ring-hydroxylating ferredoxin subunit